MTQREFRSYKFNSVTEQSDELLIQLMDNATEKVKQSNQE